MRPGTLSSTSPLFAVPLALFVLKEQVTGRLLAGVGLTRIGVWLIVAPWRHGHEPGVAG